MLRYERWWKLWLVLILILFWLSQTWPLTLGIQEQVFFGCTVPPNSKETKPGSCHQEAFSSAGKNTRVVLVSCFSTRIDLVRPYSYCQCCGYFWGPWVSFFATDEFSVRVMKLTLRIDVSRTHDLSFYF